MFEAGRDNKGKANRDKKSKLNSSQNMIHGNAAARYIGKNICYVFDIFELQIPDLCPLNI